MARCLAHTVAAGVARYRPVADLEVISGDTVLDVPGRPRVIPTRGTPPTTARCWSRTAARCSRPTRWVNFDYASGERGLRLHRFNEDRQSRPKPRDSLKAEGGRT